MMILVGIFVFIISILLIYFSYKQIIRTRNTAYTALIAFSLLLMFFGIYLIKTNSNDYLTNKHIVSNKTIEYVEIGKFITEGGDTIKIYKIK